MPAWDSKSEPAIQRFWDKYIILLGKQGIKPGQHRWYVRHIERYISNYSKQKLVTHTPEQVSAYLHKLGRQKSLEDWQFVQAVRACIASATMAACLLFILRDLCGNVQLFAHET
ncbi:MAG: hypothetical protein IME93_03020 [Proteobacteria bacterium]|nr:hypothetical protein [Pseudomonadota bacterium]